MTGDGWDLARIETLQIKLTEEDPHQALLEEVGLQSPLPVGSELAKQETLGEEPWLGEKPPWEYMMVEESSQLQLLFLLGQGAGGGQLLESGQSVQLSVGVGGDGWLFQLHIGEELLLQLGVGGELLLQLHVGGEMLLQLHVGGGLLLQLLVGEGLLLQLLVVGGLLLQLHLGHCGGGLLYQVCLGGWGLESHYFGARRKHSGVLIAVFQQPLV